MFSVKKIESISNWWVVAPSRHHYDHTAILIKFKRVATICQLLRIRPYGWQTVLMIVYKPFRTFPSKLFTTTRPWPTEKQWLMPAYYSRMFVSQNLGSYYVYMVPKGDTVPLHNFDLLRSFWLSSGYHHGSDRLLSGHVILVRLSYWLSWCHVVGFAHMGTRLPIGHPLRFPGQIWKFRGYEWKVLRRFTGID